MPRRYRVNQKDLKQGAKIEQQEHGWASDTRSRRIARDHLQKYGPGFYRAEPVSEKMVHNINKKMGARPIRKARPQPQPVVFI